MLDQNTDRMWYVIGAVLIGAAIILIANGSMPQLFANVGGMYTDTLHEVIPRENIYPNSNNISMIPWGGSNITKTEVPMPKEWRHVSDYTYATEYIIDVDESISTSHAHTSIQQPDYLDEGNTYTWSYYMKNTGNVPIRIQPNYWSTPEKNMLNPGESARIHSSHVYQEYGSKQMQFINPEGKDIKFVLAMMKVEEGDHLSPYIPHREDEVR